MRSLRRPAEALALLAAGMASACGTPGADVPPPEPLSPRTAQDVASEADRAAVDVLERGLVGPDTVVDRAYINNLIEARDRVFPLSGRAESGSGPWLTTEESQEIGGRLRDSLSSKRGPALIAALRTVLHLHAADGAAFRDAVLRAWPEGDAEFRRHLLDYGWESVRCEEVVPLLRAECDEVPPRTQWHHDNSATMALLRLLEMRPDEGRARILADVALADPRFGGRALVALPDERLDEVDARFRQPLEKRWHWSFDLEKFGPLAERYGGPDAVAGAKELLNLPNPDLTSFNASALLVRVVLSHDRAEGLKCLGLALRNSKDRSGIRPADLLKRVLGNGWIQQRDLWGSDARAFVHDIATAPDPRIDEKTREAAKELLEDRAREADSLKHYRNPPPR